MRKLLLSFLMVLPVAAMADNTGKCGPNVSYTFEESTKTLYIRGEGKILDPIPIGIGFDASADIMSFSNFQTWGYDALDGGLTFGASGSEGKAVTRMDDVWTYGQQQYWTKNPMNFVAIAPASSKSIVKNTVKQDETSLDVSVTTGVIIPTDASDQEDILFAASSDIGKYDNDGIVDYDFNHALSQIVFKGKLPANGAVTKVVIEEITLGNIGSKGALTYDSNGSFFAGKNYVNTADPAVYKLTGEDLEANVWEQGKNTTAGVPFDLTKRDSEKKNVWYLLPQRTDAWSATNTDELKAGGMTSAPAVGAYLKLRVRLEKDGAVILSSDESSAIYFPFHANWDRNKRYIYTFEFKGPFSPNTLTPITYSVATADWTDKETEDEFAFTRAAEKEEDAKLTPWWNFRDKIEKVVIEEGITGIGSYAFYECKHLQEVSIPESVKEIDAYAFALCENLGKVDVKGADKASDIGAFLYCNKAAFKGDYKPQDPLVFNEYLICDNDTIVTMEDYFIIKDTMKIEATGLIFATKTDRHPVLAVNTNESSVAFSSTLPYNFGTSCDTKAYDGFDNSSLFTHSWTSPIGDYLITLNKQGARFYAPSVAEAMLLQNASYHINRMLKQMKTSGDNVKAITNNDNSVWYWSSTEDVEDPANMAWACNMTTGEKESAEKSARHSLRAIFQYPYFHELLDRGYPDPTLAIMPTKIQKQTESRYFYTLSGQRVTNPKRGIYIKDGKKVIIGL